MGDGRAPGRVPEASTTTDFFCEGKVRMNHPDGPVGRIKRALGIGLLTGLMGCVGYVDGGYRGAVLVPGPDIYVFGGGYERGRDVHAYSQRGYESRGAAHPVSGGQEGRSAPGRPVASPPVHSGGGGSGPKR